MTITSTTSTSDGVTATFSIPFPFFSRSDVSVLVNDVAYTGVVTWVSDSLISLAPVPANGVKVTRRRITPDTPPKATFTNTNISATGLNANQTQDLYLAQEAATEAARAFRAPTGEAGPVMGAAAARAGKVQEYDDAGGSKTDRSFTDFLNQLATLLGINQLLSSLIPSANKLAYFTSASAMALTDLTAFARTLLGAANSSAFLAALGQIASTAVGYLSGLAGGVTRLLHSKLSDEVSVKDLGCAVDGVIDDTTAFDAAITTAAATRRTLVIPAGTMKIGAAISNASTFVSVRGEPGAIIDMSAGGSWTQAPGITALPALAANITTASATVTFATAHGLAAGDVFVVWNPTDYSQGPHRAEYHAGRMFKVSSITSATAVVVFGTPRKAFASASFNAYKLNGGRCLLSNLEVIPNTTLAVPFQLDGFAGVTVEDVTIRSGSSSTALDIYRCYDFLVTRTNSTALLSDAYPIIIANCQKGRVSDLTGVYSRRHCVAFGGRAGTGTVPTADVLISGCILENITSNGIGAADVHGGCEDITYDNCIMEGAVIGGRNPTIRNSTIYGRPAGSYADGTCVVSSEIVGGVYTLENNRFVSFGDASTYGILLFEIDRRTEDWTLVARNNTIYNPNAAVRGIHTLVGDATPPAFAARIEIDGLVYSGASLAQLISVSGLNDVTARMTGSVVNVTGPITTYLGASLAANYSVPVSFPTATKGVKVRGDVDVSLSARVDFATQLWSTTLTVDRFITLPNDGSAIHGDRFHIIRTAGGATRVLQVLGTNLWPGMSATVVYQGAGGGVGSWIVESLGSLSLDTGWTAGSGTANKGAFATYAGQTVSAAYVQAEAQATDNAVKAAAQRLLALEQAALNRITSA